MLSREEWNDIPWKEQTIADAYHALIHYKADSDIRAKDSAYDLQQEDVLRDAIRRLTLAEMFEDNVVALLRELLSGYEPDIASVTVEPSRDPAGGEDINVTPLNPLSAPIYVHVIGQYAYLCFGKNSRSELLADSPRSEIAALNTLRRMADAVIHGRFVEELWLIEGKIVKSLGIFKLGDKTGKLRYWGVFNPFRAREKQRFNYQPYHSVSSVDKA
jgi:hypothetical protein